MYSFISTSFENNLTKLNLLPGFFISSFLLVVSILGIMYLGVIFGQELGFLSEIKN
jgi:DNA phosphorothioation-dependent restriction protein DptG